MKIILKFVFFIFTLFNITVAFAATEIFCFDESNGAWESVSAPHTTMTRQVNVGAQQFPKAGIDSRHLDDKFYALSPVVLQCRNAISDNNTYQLRLARVTRANAGYSPAFINAAGTVSYAYTGVGSYPPQLNDTSILPLPPRNSLGTVEITPSIAVHSSTNIDVITSGSLIGTLRFNLVINNILQATEYFDIQLITTNELVFRPETCMINNNEPLDVDLGTMSLLEIPVSTGANSTIYRDLNLNYLCDTNITSKMRVQLVGQPSAFSARAVEARTGRTYGAGTRIDRLGVEFSRNNVILAPNATGFITDIEKGRGADTLRITPVRTANSNNINVPDGFFNATATLLFSVP